MTPIYRYCSLCDLSVEMWSGSDFCPDCGSHLDDLPSCKETQCQ